MVWLLWSMKEAAYKIYNRQTKIRSYFPQKLECSFRFQNHSYMSGTVICGGNRYYTKTNITNDCIHTIAVTNPDLLKKVIEIEKKILVRINMVFPF